MSRTYVKICVAVACGSVWAVGCYTESTIDQVNQLPAGKPRRGTRAATQPGRGPGEVASPTTQESRARKVARQTEQYRQRVKGDPTARTPTETKVARPGAVAATHPSESKQAAHVGSDLFETGTPQPMAVAKIDADAPWHRSTRRPTAKPAGPQPTKQKPAPQVATPEPKPPTDAKTGRVPAPAVEAATAKAKPVTPTGRAARPRPATPEAQKPEPSPGQPSPAGPAPARPTVPPAPTAKAKTSADKASGFIVPRPPAIPRMSAKGAAQKPAKTPTAPPAKPTLVVRVPSPPKTTAERETTAQPNKPAQIGPPAKQDMKAVIDQKLKEVAANPNDLEKQMVLRLLYLADKQPKNARSEIPGTKPQIQAIIDKLMSVNITALQGQGRDTAVAATKMLADVDRLRNVLRPHADLEIPTVKLCTRVERFSVYDEIQPRFQAGKRNRAIVYCEIKNFTWVPTEDSQWRALLGQRVKILNEEGETIYQTPDEDVPYTNRQRLEDFYLGRIVELPSGLRPGKYVLRVYVEDKLAGKASENQIEFRLTR